MSNIDTSNDHLAFSELHAKVNEYLTSENTCVSLTLTYRGVEYKFFKVESNGKTGIVYQSADPRLI